jgi:hypothetical protein
MSALYARTFGEYRTFRTVSGEEVSGWVYDQHLYVTDGITSKTIRLELLEEVFDEDTGIRS